MVFLKMVFQELTKNYLLQWGREWKGLAPYDLLYLYEYKNLPQENPNERIVVLNRVLADSFNRGYTELRHLVLDEVNGRKIKSLEELKSVLRDQPVMHHGQRYARFRFLHGGGEVILDYEGLSNAHARIAKTYEISTATSFFGNEGISPSPALEK